MNSYSIDRTTESAALTEFISTVPVQFAIKGSSPTPTPSSTKDSTTDYQTSPNTTWTTEGARLNEEDHSAEHDDLVSSSFSMSLQRNS